MGAGVTCWRIRTAAAPTTPTGRPCRCPARTTAAKRGWVGEAFDGNVAVGMDGGVHFQGGGVLQRLDMGKEQSPVEVDVPIGTELQERIGGDAATAEGNISLRHPPYGRPWRCGT